MNELNEALDTLSKAGLIAERATWTLHNGERNQTKYGNHVEWSGYTFKNPTPNSRYVKVLVALRDGEKTKEEVHKIVGLENWPGMASGMWTALRREGLVDFERRGNTVIWFITPRGMDFLDEAGITEN